jgi:hypothetical protein
MNHYADAEGPLIAEITERAEAWACTTGWTPRDAEEAGFDEKRLP